MLIHFIFFYDKLLDFTCFDLSGAGVEYLFNGLNAIKPQMIAEATQNARKAAEQFARDSGSQVGKIKRASQGLFSIDDAAPGLPERKSVRVVTTVEYILSD